MSLIRVTKTNHFQAANHFQVSTAVQTRTLVSSTQV